MFCNNKLCIFVPHSLKNTPMGDELKELFKEGGGCIFESCDISLINTPTSHAVSLPIFMYACSDSAMLLFCSTIAYEIQQMVSAFIC